MLNHTPSDNNSYQLAIDIGGTHADFVLIQGNKVIRKLKVAIRTSDEKKVTQESLTQTIIDGVSQIIESPDSIKVSASQIKNIFVGNTHFVNALISREGLSKVGLVRLSLPYSDATEPCIAWSNSENGLRKHIHGFHAIAHGGSMFNGDMSHPLVNSELERIVAEVKKNPSISALAISAPFSFLYPDMENQARSILERRLKEELGDDRKIDICVSHEVGGHGLIQRENLAILNASLRKVSQTVCTDMQMRLKEVLPDAKLFGTLNDGTFASWSEIEKFPVLAYSSSTLNSARGAVALTGEDDIDVIDIGGTSTDFVPVRDGAPLMTRLGNYSDQIEDIPCNLTSASNISIALGGGTKIDVNDPTDPFTQKSVGCLLDQDAKCFGGNKLTLTDIAVAVGKLTLGVEPHLSALRAEYAANKKFYDDIYFQFHVKLAQNYLKLVKDKTQRKIVLVGGGAQLVNPEILSEALETVGLTRAANQILIPDNADVANAIGASKARIRLRKEVLLTPDSNAQNSDTLADLESKVKADLTEQGATNIKIVERHGGDVAYLKGFRQCSVSAEGAYDPERCQVAQSVQYDTSSLVAAVLSTEEIVSDVIQDGKEMHIRKYDFDVNQVPDGYLNREDILAASNASTIFGSGGGGGQYLGVNAALSFLMKGQYLKLAHLETLNDDDYIATIAYAGSPYIGEEIGFSNTESIAALKKLQEKLGKDKKIVGIVPGETAGANALLPMITALSLGLPYIDATSQPRAFLLLTTATPYLCGGMEDHYEIIANSHGDVTLITDTTMDAVQARLPSELVKLGGSCVGVSMAMTVRDAKKKLAVGAFSNLMRVGNALEASKNEKLFFVDAFNNALKEANIADLAGDNALGTEPMQFIAEGRIIDIEFKQVDSHHYGNVLIEANDKKIYRIRFENENFGLETESGEIISVCPDIINLHDVENPFVALNTAQYKLHQKVYITTLKMGKLYYTDENIQKVVPNGNGDLNYKDKLCVGFEETKDGKTISRPHSMAGKQGTFFYNYARPYLEKGEVKQHPVAGPVSSDLASHPLITKLNPK